MDEIMGVWSNTFTIHSFWNAWKFKTIHDVKYVIKFLQENYSILENEK